jgi:hypothetical protein
MCAVCAMWISLWGACESSRVLDRMQISSNDEDGRNLCPFRIDDG